MLEFRGVGLTRENRGTPVRVLDDVSFTVPPGTVYTILGPSGSGKSTLLRLAARLEDPDQGTIRFHDRDVREQEVLVLRRRIGLVFQETALFGGTVEDDLRFAADPAGDGRLEDPGAWLARVGLPPDLLGRGPDELSVGQRQRVAFARALVAGPEVLLLDEPTSALDPKATKEILRLVRELRDRFDLTVVFVTHAVAQARRVADRVLVLEGGRVLEEGDRTIFGSPRRPETRAFFAGEEE